LKKVIELSQPDSRLIGFSIGASIIWRLSEKVSARSVKDAICFYGSQIRNYTDINPQFQIELIFPQSEPHFDISEPQSKLSKTHNVKMIKANYFISVFKKRHRNT